jgi:hypothetical protein
MHDWEAFWPHVEPLAKMAGMSTFIMLIAEIRGALGTPRSYRERQEKAQETKRVSDRQAYGGLSLRCG